MYGLKSAILAIFQKRQEWPRPVKAELLQEGIFFLIHLFSREVLVMKKLEIKKTKPTFIDISFKS
jgi:hypothetical protein